MCVSQLSELLDLPSMPLVIQKVDSGLKGNVAAETAALHAVSDARGSYSTAKIGVGE